MAPVELRQLRYFVALAEELHFGRAAQRLHIVQSALSKQIGALERELGATLFDRAQGVRLTPAGETLYVDAVAVLAGADDAVRNVRAAAQGEHGSLRVGYIGSAMWSVLPAILKEHRLRHPDLRFHLRQLPSPDQVEALRDGSLDVGFLRPPVDDARLAAEPLWRERLVVALPADHPLAAREAIDLADLRDEPFIVLPRQRAPSLHDLYLSVCVSYGFRPRTLEEADSLDALHFVGIGLAVALLPEAVRGANRADVVFRPLDRPTPEVDLLLGYRRDGRSPALRAFVETARAVAPTVHAAGRPVPPRDSAPEPAPAGSEL